MSVLLRFHTVSDTDLSEILQEPIKLEILYYGEVLDPSALDDLDDEAKDNILTWTPEVKSDVLYVEGMFQSLHYLLTAESDTNLGAFPLNFLNGKRQEAGEIGWGPVTFYNSNDVQIIAEALDELDLSELERKFDPAILNEMRIFPRGYVWKKDDIGSLLEKIKEITAFLKETKNKHLGLYRIFV
ncbi:MAG: DUF1877 family protein [Bacteroidetes bacterium]|nr:DUF1877 family protein [Bacteroidota bacterium]